MALHNESFALRPVLEDIVAEVAPLANKNGTSIETRFGTGMLYTIATQVITSMLLLTVIDVNFR